MSGIAELPLQLATQRPRHVVAGDDRIPEVHHARDRARLLVDGACERAVEASEARMIRVFERQRGLLGVDRRGLALGLLRDRAPGGLWRFDLLRLRQLGSRTRLGLELGLPDLEHRRRHARGRFGR
ncbi:MAG: hypothetical protein L6Q84_10545 [Polyangiaceae bacterium]|nr:hypothetical protein [Polyangiaceae bacterium]